ncbi:hypothetical protein EVAR_36911_1 [Eumeta japonica]|uniref:Uncharacterized protein n=1 Tax=Eumeta variegata TaxID=151549 RepID=A0A4C1X7V5_EUMVA|nr:hypothetical protein EVAR_36911_1 [Eumeta japonica]
MTTPYEIDTDMHGKTRYIKVGNVCFKCKLLVHSARGVRRMRRPARNTKPLQGYARVARRLTNDCLRYSSTNIISIGYDLHSRLRRWTDN